MAVCSNEWCDKYQQIHLSSDEYHNLRRLRSAYAFERSFYGDSFVTPDNPPPPKKKLCHDCTSLCISVFCEGIRLEFGIYCKKCFVSKVTKEQLKQEREHVLKSISIVPPFCPECGALCFPKFEYQVNCPNFRCGYNGPLDPVLGEKLRHIDLKINTLSAGGSVQPILEDSNKGKYSKFQILDRKSKSFTGYFDWPSTEIYPTFHGSKVDASEWPDQSPLNLMGYNVNSKENLSAETRQEILSFVYASSTLPYVKSEGYMTEWGPASGVTRLKKIADNLATHGRNMRRKGYRKPLGKYDEDLAYLKKKYYDGMFAGDWPSTQPYN